MQASDNKSFLIESSVKVVDGASSTYQDLLPGDTLLLQSGLRSNLLLIRINGSATKPIIIINQGGVVRIDTDSYYGISIRESRYFRLTGQGSESEFYGIRIDRVASGAGIGINDLCSDYEIDHISIENTLMGGIYAKTDPNCNTPSTRDKFTQYNTIIHDNHIARVGNEGMYIGSTNYFGTVEKCNGRDTLLIPALLEGVRIYNNIVEFTAWDGIQVSSASKNCQIYGNLILHDSQEGYFSQMSGIMLGGGSKCDCYNNYIGQGNGSGIESHGLGGYRIFNNIIVDAGRSFHPLDSSVRVHGIYVSDITVEKDSAVHILFNDIINPKMDGIRFQSIVSKNSVIASNLIVNPGGYDYYEHDNTSHTGADAYIMIPDESSHVLLRNNYMTRDMTNAKVSLIDYKPLEISPLVDAAYSDRMGIDFDFNNALRPNGLLADIGAYEYDHAGDSERIKSPLAYPNPVKSLLTIRFDSYFATDVSLLVYDQSGTFLFKTQQTYFPGRNQEISIQVNNLPSGLYLYSVVSRGTVQSGKFIKIS